MLAFDHIAIGCEALADGVDEISALLGVPMTGGGRHARFGTHNKLLGLGPDLYLEVIALDPEATSERQTPAWFALDAFRGRTRPCNWICATDDLATAMRAMPADPGPAVPVSRDDLHWDITVPSDGHLPLDGAQPTILRWGQGVAHPASLLPDVGCRLTRWEVIHPEADMLAQSLPISDPRLRFLPGPAPAFRATIQTPNGQKVLS